MAKNYIKWLRKKVRHAPVILVAAGAIVEGKNGTILFQQRGDRKTVVWGLPGGMMELGETAEQTMRREVKEETGVNVTVKYFLGAYTNSPIDTYPNGDKAHVVLLVFVCKPSGGTFRADEKETLNVRYEDPKKIKDMFPRHIRVVQDYLDKKQGVVR